MHPTDQGLRTLQEIRTIMERSSRFISLSGWSGIAAGAFALAGAYIARLRISLFHMEGSELAGCETCLRSELLALAAAMFAAALISALIFTRQSARKNGDHFWGPSSQRLLWHSMLPLVAGGFLLWRMVQIEQYALLPAVSLVFYGLGLVSGSKYTRGEVGYLGYAQLLTGLVAIWLTEWGLLLWAFGFGVLHIVYGLVMWWRPREMNPHEQPH